MLLGRLGIITKELLPPIITVDPEAVAICSTMTPDMEEIKEKLSSFIPEEFIPEFYYIEEASNYMLDGITELCIEHMKKGQ